MAHLKDAYNPAVPLAVAIAYAVRHPARASATGGVSPGRPAVCLGDDLPTAIALHPYVRDAQISIPSAVAQAVMR